VGRVVFGTASTGLGPLERCQRRSPRLRQVARIGDGEPVGHGGADRREQCGITRVEFSGPDGVGELGLVGDPEVGEAAAVLARLPRTDPSFAISGGARRTRQRSPGSAAPPGTSRKSETAQSHLNGVLMYTEKIFGPDYLRMRHHSLDALTAEHLTALSEVLGIDDANGKMRLLDLGCGPGRLAVAFAERGHDVVGVDQSDTLLTTAAQLGESRGVSVRWVRSRYADMPQLGKFDGIYCWSTSFGYGTDEENETTLRRCRDIGRAEWRERMKR